MKNIFYILLLLPTIIFAQYPSNSGHKITLGEQTTADGFIYRGVAETDTVRKPSIDTMAYMVLDTTTNIMWHYKKATSNAWLRLNLLPSDTASMLTNYWRAGRFSGTLPLLNGGTGSATQNFVDLTTTQSIAGAKTFTSSTIFTTAFNHSSFDGGINVQNTGTLANLRSSQLRLINGSTTFGANDRSYQLANVGTSATASKFTFAYFDGTNYFERLTIFPTGNLGINTSSPQESLHVTGNARITAVGAGTFSNNLNITSDGTLTTATSDEKFKYNIRPLNHGLETLLQLKPVNFQWIEGEEEDLGFIAQDVAEIIPEAVNTNWNSDLLFRYESLIPILTKAIQEQQALIKALEQRIINLENK
jgi:hypothetical protein